MLFRLYLLVLLLSYAVLSAACFVAYARDKSAARRGARRTPERRLLLLGLAGGWPGAVLAQQMLRHKTAKPVFQLLFWCSVLLNVGVLAAAVWLEHSTGGVR
jgi:uncharacterized membrane protein YsdA (DUF1294 family)